MSIVVTGATGQLGGLVVENLLQRGVPASEIVVAGRNQDRLAELEKLGVTAKAIDFEDPASLLAAFEGADRVLLVSGNEVGDRVRLHGNAIDAAKAAGVKLLVYTSFPKASDTAVLLAGEHGGTEAKLVASGVPYTALRNSLYMENYAGRAAEHVGQGTILGSAGSGRITSATRAELAEAAAVVLTTDGHENKVYELGGDEAFTMDEFAAELTRQSGRPVEYKDLPVDEYAKILVGAGLPEGFAGIIADNDRGASVGELHTQTGDLARLLGRAPTTMPDAVAAALKG
jgi:NAD(P)H dehydrogenase (quinone)